MIVSLSASLNLMSLLILIGMVYGDDQAAWPTFYKNRIKNLRKVTATRLLISAIHSAGFFWRLLHAILVLFFTWFLTCALFAGAHMFGGLLEMALLPADATFLGLIFIAIVAVFIVSVYIIVFYGLLMHLCLYPLALGAAWARRGGSDKRFVTLLSLACGAAGILVRVNAT